MLMQLGCEQYKVLSLHYVANRNMTMLTYQMQYLPFQLILKKALRRRGKERLLRPKEVEN